ncbi:MAG: ATP-dependent zinc metalloprotease FtsH, partial [Acetanaerobacterium sp.]
KAMITRYGFSEKLGPVVYGQAQEEIFLGRDFNNARDFSEAVASEIDGEMRGIIEVAFERAKEILGAHLDQLHELAKYLLACEKMDSEDFRRFMSGELNVDAEIAKWNTDHADEKRFAEELLQKAAEAEKTAKMQDTPASDGQTEPNVQDQDVSPDAKQ